MSLYQLLDLSLSLSNRIDTHWALFISVHLALIGGIIYVERPLFIKEKVVAVVVYSAFAVINYVLMRNQTFFLESLYLQIYSMQDLACCNDNLAVVYVVNWLEENGIKRMTASIFFTHLVMYIVLVMSIAFDKPLNKKQ